MDTDVAAKVESQDAEFAQAVDLARHEVAIILDRWREVLAARMTEAARKRADEEGRLTLAALATLVQVANRWTDEAANDIAGYLERHAVQVEALSARHAREVLALRDGADVASDVAARALKAAAVATVDDAGKVRRGRYEAVRTAVWSVLRDAMKRSEATLRAARRQGRLALDVVAEVTGVQRSPVARARGDLHRGTADAIGEAYADVQQAAVEVANRAPDAVEDPYLTRISETFDHRTHPISFVLHGQARTADGFYRAPVGEVAAVAALFGARSWAGAIYWPIVGGAYVGRHLPAHAYERGREHVVRLSWLSADERDAVDGLDSNRRR